MNDLLTWGTLIAAAGSLVAWIKFWIDQGKVQEKVEVAASTASLAAAKHELLALALSDFKVEAARTYATIKALSDTEAALANTLDKAAQGIYSRLDNVTARLDSLITIARHADHG
jgi:hypothetical protein